MSFSIFFRFRIAGGTLDCPCWVRGATGRLHDKAAQHWSFLLPPGLHDKYWMKGLSFATRVLWIVGYIVRSGRCRRWQVVDGRKLTDDSPFPWKPYFLVHIIDLTLLTHVPWKDYGRLRGIESKHDWSGRNRFLMVWREYDRYVSRGMLHCNGSTLWKWGILFFVTGFKVQSVRRVCRKWKDSIIG